MANNIIYQGNNKAPVNKIALRVLGSGVNFEFKNTEPHREESLTPFPITWGRFPFSDGFINLKGRQVGRLTVIGWNDDNGRWVCRCSCGTYVYRKSKAIKNSKNKIDACYQCHKLIEVRKKYHFLVTGKDIERESL